MPALDIVQYYGLVAPAGTPRPVVDRLNKELRGILASEDFKSGSLPRAADLCPVRRKNTPPTLRAKKENGRP